MTLKFKNIDKNILFLLSISIFLSPTFRSLAIWPDSRIIGLTFFTLSIYEFLKFNNSKNISSFYKNIIYLLIASYISPNFSVFIIFYFFCFLKNVNKKHILIGIFLCGLSSLPALYYLFVLDINFLLAKTPGADINDKVSLDFNISNKKTLRSQELKPEIRLYDKPVIITYEASIDSNLFSDTYLTMSNISETDVFNIKFQIKPFMNFIWFSVLLLSLGGILNFFKRNKNETN